MPMPKKGLPKLDDDNEKDEEKKHYMKLFGYNEKPEEFEDLFNKAKSIKNKKVDDALDDLLPEY